MSYSSSDKKTQLSKPLDLELKLNQLMLWQIRLVWRFRLNCIISIAIEEKETGYLRKKKKNASKSEHSYDNYMYLYLTTTILLLC
jgi:hypothetical protein